MDRSTVAGALLGLLCVGGAIFIGPTANAFWSVPAILIVFGGTFATTLIRYPIPVVVAGLRVLRHTISRPPPSAVALVRQIAGLADLVRRESLLAMENERVDDPFLKRGIELSVDGVDPATIETVLRGDIASALEAYDRGQRILRSMGASAPAFGMIGTLIGLVQMLTRMDDPSRIGGSMAVAILTTFYGAVLAYLVFLPMADKLEERARLEAVNREIAMQGLNGILMGHHPRIIERQLISLLEPGRRRGEVEFVRARRGDAGPARAGLTGARAGVRRAVGAGDRAGGGSSKVFSAPAGDRPGSRPADRLEDRPADRPGSGDRFGDRLGDRSGDRLEDRPARTSVFRSSRGT